MSRAGVTTSLAVCAVVNPGAVAVTTNGPVTPSSPCSTKVAVVAPSATKMSMPAWPGVAAVGATTARLESDTATWMVVPPWEPPPSWRMNVLLTRPAPTLLPPVMFSAAGIDRDDLGGRRMGLEAGGRHGDRHDAGQEGIEGHASGRHGRGCRRRTGA